MADGDIIELVLEYESELLSGKRANNRSFYTAIRIQKAVKAAIKIEQENNFTSQQLEIVTLTAWLQDCGYFTNYLNYEGGSKMITSNFLNKNGYSKDAIEQVLACIEATRFPQNTKLPEDEVCADADLYRFKKTKYPRYEQQLRKESENHLDKTITDIEWGETNYTLQRNRCYYPSYGKNILQKFKKVDIERLKNTN